MPSTVHNSGVCATFMVRGRGEVHRHHDARIVVTRLAERLSQRTAVWLIFIMKMVIRILDLILFRVAHLLQIVVNVQRVNEIGLENVIRHRAVGIRGFIPCGIRFKELSSNRGEVLCNKENGRESERDLSKRRKEH